MLAVKKKLIAKKQKRDEEDEEPRKRRKEEEEEGPRTVYAAGLSYEATEADVRAFFSPLEVTDVRMPRYQDSGRPRGYAHVDFASAGDAARALEKNLQDLKGRYVTVELARDKVAPVPGPKPKGCTTIFVKNLPYDANEDVVRTAFARFGKIADVRLAVWNHTKRVKGHGYVQFVTEFAAEQAVKHRADVKIRGRAVVVDYDGGQGPKGSFRTTDGRPWAKTRVGKKCLKHKRLE